MNNPTKLVLRRGTSFDLLGLWAILGLVLLLLFTGCLSKPVKQTVVAPSKPAPIQFKSTATEPLDSRWDAETQAIVAESNRVWASRTTDTAAYLRCARLLNASLEEGGFNTPEEEVRLATMSVQHALRANDTETLRSAVKHWEAGYRGIRKAPIGGEIESYLLGMKRLNRDLPEDLINIAHPEIQAVLRSES